MTKSSISDKLVCKYKLWLETKDGIGILGSGKIDFLRAIDIFGSIKGACDNTGISYRKAWGNLQHDESLLGFQIVKRQRGGEKGGKTSLTEEGLALIRIYDTLQIEFKKTYNKVIKEIFNETLN